MRARRNRHIDLGIDNVDDEMIYAVELYKPHGISREDIYDALVYGERPALGPLAAKLRRAFEVQQEARRARAPEQIRAGKHLSPLVVGYLTRRMFRRCDIGGWRVPRDLFALLDEIVAHTLGQFEVPPGWSGAQSRAFHIFSRDPGASTRKVGRAVGVKHSTVEGWLKTDRFRAIAAARLRGTARNS